jgi:L-lactate dehydrogenase complex protein LldG
VSARDDILARVAAATADLGQTPAIVRNYRGADGRGGGTDPALVDVFAERVADYQATVRRCRPDDVVAMIATMLTERVARRVVVPAGFPPRWASGVSEAVGDDPPLEVGVLDSLDGVITTCALGIAETGTIVLDAGPGQGRRALTLVPDYHLAVVRAEQIVAGLPDAIAKLEPTRPLTWISGPSATSDIELNRVEGVHGPRTLDVLVVDRTNSSGLL